MVEPDHAIAVWNELIAALPEPDSQKARELLLRVQGRQRTAGMPEASLESAPHATETVPVAAIIPNVPAVEAMPDNLHDLLALFQ